MLESLGLIGMFVSAFLAATILPLGSEAVMIALYKSDYSPAALWLVATIANVAGSLVNYIIGRTAGRPGLKALLKVSDTAFARAEQRYRRFGTVSLCFAWVPVIGDPLTMLAGVIKVPIAIFLGLVTVGKGLRYWALLSLLPS